MSLTTSKARKHDPHCAKVEFRMMIGKYAKDVAFPVVSIVR